MSATIKIDESVALQRWVQVNDIELDTTIRNAVSDLWYHGRAAQKALRAELLPALQEVKRRYDAGQTIFGIGNMEAYLKHVGLNPTTVRSWMMRARAEELKQLIGDIFVDMDIPAKPEPPPQPEPVEPPVFEGVVRETMKRYSQHQLSSTHFRGKNPFGHCEAWAYARGGDSIGWAVMRKDGITYTLRRLIVKPDLPRDEYIQIGQALIRRMTEEYSAWTAVTDVENEAPFYHEFYRVADITESKMTAKKAPKEIASIPLTPDDWQSRDKCTEFLKAHPEWHAKIVKHAATLGRDVRPAGKKLTLPALQKKLENVDTAARVLQRCAPARQVKYTFKSASPRAVPAPKVSTTKALQTWLRAKYHKATLRQSKAFRRMNRYELTIDELSAGEVKILGEVLSKFREKSASYSPAKVTA